MMSRGERSREEMMRKKIEDENIREQKKEKEIHSGMIHLGGSSENLSVQISGDQECEAKWKSVFPEEVQFLQRRQTAGFFTMAPRLPAVFLVRRPTSDVRLQMRQHRLRKMKGRFPCWFCGKSTTRRCWACKKSRRNICSTECFRSVHPGYGFRVMSPPLPPYMMELYYDAIEAREAGIAALPATEGPSESDATGNSTA